MAVSPATYNAILLGAQAAGLGADIFGQSERSRASRAGYGLEQGELSLRMQEEELAFKEANINSLNQLRETLSAQRAIFAARGQMAGAGSALSAGEASVREYNADKEARRLSQLFRTNQLKSMSRLAGIKQGASAIEGGTKLIGTSLNMFSLNEALYSKRGASKSTGTTKAASGIGAYKPTKMANFKDMSFLYKR